jgi:hypothetical protein
VHSWLIWSPWVFIIHLDLAAFFFLSTRGLARDLSARWFSSLISGCLFIFLSQDPRASREV